MGAAINFIAEIRPKQARSRARRQALIERGAKLLNVQDFDEIAVTDITGQLGYSTGSFYSYFRDKEAFFAEVQKWVNEELDVTFDKTFAVDRLIGASLSKRLEICLEFTLEYFRKRTGVIRNALRYERRIPDGWMPNRSRTQQIIDVATTNLGPDERERLENALQLAFGLMVNTVLHNPGPMQLSDEDLQKKILTALGPYLDGQL